MVIAAPLPASPAAAAHCHPPPACLLPLPQVDGPPGADAAGGVDSQGQEVLQERCLTRSRSGSAAAASAPAQLPGAAAAAAAAGEQKGGQAARPSSAPVGGKGSGAAGQQAAQPAAAEAGAAAAGSPRQLVLGGGIRPGSGWQQDAGGRWSRVLTATSCRGGSVSLSFPRELPMACICAASVLLATGRSAQTE